eukprot:NODE_3699_length_917_cov_36.412658_g3547_i0.p1 GENE.NODE_3699_length_917_cov_36.412658_g3547_i0~~NODE_3699_length_917_cov_36.412658_g3547_i0.p1  ORF type:complete len:275 (-),score=78.95 NODE_3699_length_917_cov_36.412658_g3547_i0:92-859(-)
MLLHMNPREHLSLPLHAFEYFQKLWLQLHLFACFLSQFVCRKIIVPVVVLDDFLTSTDILQGCMFAYRFPSFGGMPKRTRSKILALDLDETLLYASLKPLLEYDYLVSTQCGTQLFVCERPHVKTFLQQVSQWYYVVIFTASTKIYANPLISRLDPSQSYIKKRYFRDRCTKQPDGSLVKDLSSITRLQYSTLSNCILIDNCPAMYRLQQNNAIPIESFSGKEHTQKNALLSLLPLLHALQYVSDVRSILSYRVR